MRMNASPILQFSLASDNESERFGARLAALLSSGDIVALYGNLGMGKTTLSRGLIRSLLSPDQEVPSPTYTIVQTYDCDDFLLWHFDLYRLNAPDEVIELGFEDALEDVCLIEWPEKAGDFLPNDRLSVHIEAEGTGRKITLIPGTENWKRRLNEQFGHD